MTKINFILRCKIPSLSSTDEYQYLIEVISNSGLKYQSYDVWHGYAQTAKDAKQQILLNISQTQAIDYIFDDIIIKDASHMPYFVLVDRNTHVNPIFKSIINSI